MNRVRPVQSPEQLDALLCEFFRSEMPEPWPAFQPPLSRAAVLAPPSSRADGRPAVLPFPGRAGAGRGPARPGGVLLRSRAALAASVLVFVAGSLVLPGRFTAPGLPEVAVPSDGAAERLFPDDIPVPAPEPGPAHGSPRKVKSSSYLEQGDDDRTAIKITVEEPPSNR